jgi:PAS domain S-box-containing protein
MVTEVNTRKDFESDILREQVGLAMAQIPTMQGASFIVALILCYVVRDIVSYENILQWIMLVLLTVIGKMLLYSRFSKVRKDPFGGAFWKNSYCILALISGAVWGLSAFIIFPSGNPERISLIVLVMGSLAATTTLSHSSMKFAPTAWAGPAALFYAIRLAMEGGEFGYTLSLLIIIYLLTILSYSLKHNRFITSAIALRFENLKLLGEVRRINDSLSQEIGERKIAQETLKESEAQLRQIIDLVPQMIFVKDWDGKYLLVNKAVADAYNTSVTALTGACHADFHTKKSELQNMLQDDREVITKGKTKFIPEESYTDAQGNPHILQTTKVPFHMTGDKTPAVLGVAIDITNNKRAEEILRESEARYRLISENTGDVIWQFDLETDQFVYVSPSVHRLLGCTPEDVVGQNMETVLTPASMQFVRKRLPEIVAALSAGDESFRVLTHEVDQVRKDGSIVHTEIVTTLLQDANGRVVGIIGVTRDITEQRHAAERLRESEEKYRLFVETALEGTWAVDAEHRITFVNQVMCDKLGYGIEEIMGHNVADFIAEEHLGDHKARMDARSKGVSEKYERKFRRKDGGELWLIVSVRALMDENGGFLGAFSMLTDITERKQAERERREFEGKLRQAQKLEAIGTLAGGIAHDFNNILVPIMGYAEMALSSTSQFNPIRNGLEQILNAAQRARDLVKQILVFGRSGKEQQKIPVEISSIIKEVLKLLRASLPSSIEIRQNIGNGVACADATQIHQVLINLCTNAAHAMSDKGILEVSLTRVDSSKSDLPDQAIVDLKPGQYLKLSVSDTGTGIDGRTRQRIFDPYFTTKEVGKGSGLGLAVVHGIVRRHEGTITVQSEPGKGTTFDVYIPAAEARTGMVAKIGQVVQSGTERILLIDDEQIVVETETAILEELGYKVTSETNSLRALEIFHSGPDEFDLIVTDHTMPKMSGIDLSKEIRQMRPDIPIILCTGFSEKVTMAIAVDLGVEFLMKPFSMKQIAELVRKVLKE